MALATAPVQERGPTVLAVTCLVIALSTIFVGLRFISRVVFVRHVSLDDYFMAAAWVNSLFSSS